MYTSCPTSLDTSVRDSKLPRFCGDTTSVRTLCTSQVFPRVNMKTIWSCVTGRVYYSLYAHARVLRGAINPRSGLRASLRVLNTTFRGQSSYHGFRSKSRSRNGLTPKHLARQYYRIRKVRPGPRHLVPCQTSSWYFQETPASSGSKRSRYSLTRRLK